MTIEDLRRGEADASASSPSSSSASASWRLVEKRLGLGEVGFGGALALGDGRKLGLCLPRRALDGVERFARRRHASLRVAIERRKPPLLRSAAVCSAAAC